MTDQQLLEEENQRQKEHIKKLQSDIGKWKRLSQEKGYRPEFIREQHNKEGWHIIELYLKDIPGDSALNEVLNHLKYEVLPKYFPYKYHSCYQSKKYKGWVAKLAKIDRVDMSYVPDNIEKDALKVMDQIHWDLLMQLNRYENLTRTVLLHLDNNKHEQALLLIKTISNSYNTISEITYE